MAALLELTDKTFDDVTKHSDVPVLVDFWAFWCGPCKALAPILESIQDELGDSIQITKLDVEAFPEVAERNSVRAFPTMLLFKKGKLVSTIAGSKPRQYLLNLLKAHSGDVAASQGIDIYAGLGIHDALATHETAAVEAVLARAPETVNARNADGETPIRSAITRKSVDVVPILLKHNPQLGFVEHVALNNLDEVKAALDQNPDLLHQPYQEGKTVLQLAALWRATDTLQELTARSAPLDQLSDDKQANLLLYAVFGLSVDCLQALFDAGLKVIEEPGRSPVAMAIRPEENREILRVIALLIRRGAKANPTMKGKSLPEVVSELGWNELIPELETILNHPAR